MKFSVRWIGAGALLWCGLGPAASAQATAPSGQAEEIVVTAQRTGIPVWRVSSPTTTLVLIGAIDGVARDTRWDPAALTETLRKADRVMFPGLVQVSASPFSMIGYVMKFRRQATLPRGQSLSQMLPPADYQRLVALHRRGLIGGGFDRKHPFHLSMELRDRAKGPSGYGRGASEHVRRVVSKYRKTVVPIASVRAKSVAGDFFATPPRAYLRCLMDSVALVEAGPGTVKARSDAWAQRRVPAVLASPAEKVQHSCLPPAFQSSKPADLTGVVRRVLRERPLTVAVVDLGSLAEPGGVLDDLTAAGYDVRGPRWRR